MLSKIFKVMSGHLKGTADDKEDMMEHNIIQPSKDNYCILECFL